jgi:hypothetical protein
MEPRTRQAAPSTPAGDGSPPPSTATAEVCRHEALPSCAARLVFIIGGAVLAVRLVFEHDTEPPQTAASARSLAARDSLCEAADLVREGDPMSARAHTDLDVVEGI